jgi:TolA-binding protein
MNMYKTLAPISFSFLILTTFSPLHADEQSQIDFANGLFARNMNQEAAEEYKSYLEEYPQGQFSEVAQYRLGEVYFSLSQFPDSISILAKLLNDNPTNEFRSASLLRKGIAHYQLKQLDEANSTLTLLKDETDPAIISEANYYLGKVYSDSKQFESAKTLFQKIVNLEGSNPFKPYARFQLAHVLVNLGDLENASIAYSELAKDNTVPTALQIEGKFRAAETYDKLGWYESAESLYADLKDSAYETKASYAYIWTLYKQDKLDQAIDEAAAFNDSNPNSNYFEGLNYLLGNAYQQKKEYEKALEYYRAIYAPEKESSYARFVLYKICWSLYLKGDFDNAILRGKDFMAKYPEQNAQFFDISFVLGDSLFTRNQMEESLSYLTVATDQKRKTSYYKDALYRLAECNHAVNNLKEAAAIFDRYAREFPKTPLAAKATFRAAESLFTTKEFAETIRHLQKTLESENAKAFHEQAIYLIGLASYNLEQMEESLKYFSQLMSDFPKSPFVVESLFRIGEINLTVNKDSVLALEIFQKIINEHAASPFAAEAMKNIIICHQNMNNLDGAIENILALITEHPENILAPEIYIWMAEQLSKKESWSEAVEIYVAFLTHHPPESNTDPVFFDYALALHSDSKNDLALNYFAPFVEKDSVSPLKQMTLFHTAKIYTESKDLDKAQEAYLTASEMNTSDIAARSRFQLGILARDNNEWDVAARHFMRVAILYFHTELSPQSLWNAGQSYEKINEIEQARSAYQELLLDFPKSAFAERSQQQLRKLAAAP